MEDLFYFEGSKKRRAAKVNCPVCNTEFLTRLSWKDTNRCCSDKCRGFKRTISNSTLVNCSWCAKEYRRKNSRFGINKTEIYFCSRSCKDSAQKIGGIKEIMPPHYGTGNIPVGIRDYERYALDISKCSSCPENRYYLLNVHHIDGNRKNNIDSNLEVVCCNCHALRHLSWNGDRWVLNYKELTDRSKLEELNGVRAH